MKHFRLTAFWQALLVLVIAYLIFKYAFPPLMPSALLIQFMVITFIGVVLFYASDDQRWQEFKAPINAVVVDDKLAPVRWLMLAVVPLLVGWLVYDNVKPSLEPPVELRQVHPAPPSNLKLFDKNYDLASLENPIRMEFLAKIKQDPSEAKAFYSEAVTAGRDVYYQNCFFCHGDLLDGRGPFAEGLSPRPANFQDVGTIAQLQEAFLFWRITTGGPGLPKEGAPWNSAMPVWHEMLDENEVWNVILFLYDYVGQVPRMWDQEVSRAVTGIKNEIQSQRAEATGVEIYQQRCEVCHGEQGAGDGPAAEFLYPRPRDFTLGLFKYKTSPGTALPRDKDLFDVIKHGLTGTGMPGWSSLLSDDQIRILVPVVKSFDTAAAWAPEDAPDEAFDDDGRYKRDDFRQVSEVESVNSQVPYTDDSIAKGKKAFEEICSECHGNGGRGNITSGKRLEDDWGNRIWPRDLTKPWSWRLSNVPGPNDQQRNATIQKIYQRLSIGIPGTPMPAHRAETEGDEDPVSLEDRWHISNYVYSLRQQTTDPSGNAIINAVHHEGELPDSTDSQAWSSAPATTLLLVPNIIKEERLFTPLNDAMTVRVLFNENEIGMLLEVNDRTDSRPGEEVSTQIQDESIEMVPDAFAIQFPQVGAWKHAPIVEKPLYRHGDRERPISIWYWNAGSVDPKVTPQTLIMDGQGINQKLTPRKSVGDLQMHGKWQDGVWRLVIKRKRTSNDKKDVRFDLGEYIPIAFANWDGSNGEKGSKHTFTGWSWLLLPPKANNLKVYGLPILVALIVFLLGYFYMSYRRRNS